MSSLHTLYIKTTPFSHPTTPTASTSLSHQIDTLHAVNDEAAAASIFPVPSFLHLLPPFHHNSCSFSGSFSGTVGPHQHHRNPREGRAVHHLHPPPKKHPGGQPNQHAAQQLQPRPHHLRPHRQRFHHPQIRHSKLPHRPTESPARAISHPPFSLLHIAVPNREQPFAHAGRRQQQRRVPVKRYHLRKPSESNDRGRRRNCG